MHSYICEISPPSQRGPLTTGPQLLITVGLVAGFFTCYGTAKIDSSLAWRIPFIILACLAVMFSIASTLWLVPSPRWLTLRGRQSEASAAWDVLGVDHAEREKAEDQQSRDAVTELCSLAESTGRQDLASARFTQNPVTKPSFLDVFSRDVRTRTGLAVFMMGMQQLSGIDGVLYVSFPSLQKSLIHFPYRSSLTVQVRSCSLPTSWSRLFTSILPSVWRVCNCYFCRHYSGCPLV